MNVNLLAISIGNTRTRFGTFVDGELVETALAMNGEPSQIIEMACQGIDPLRCKSQSAVLLASVNPTLCEEVERKLAGELKRKLMRVERDLPIPVGRQLDPETLVGDDRLLNAAAAYHVLKQACVVIDAGTAITVDFVDGAGTFHGGAIAPGTRMMLDSLSRHTAQLPEVEMARPEELIGHNTAQAMLGGVFYGVRGMARELAERYAEFAGLYPVVVATGGDADMLFNGFELVERVVPDLTLIGMAVTLESALQR